MIKRKIRNYRKLKYSLRHAQRQARARKRFSNYRTKKNRRFQGISKELKKVILSNEKHKQDLETKYKDYVKISAPENLSMLENAEQTIAFINEIEKNFKLNKKVYVRLEHVKTIAHGAIVVLLSIMMKFKSHKIPFNGDKPKDSRCRHLLETSGFFKQLYRQEGEGFFIDADRIFTHANKIVDQQLSDNLIEAISTLIWKEPRRCPRLQRDFIELMQNTNNHADIMTEGVHHWWTTAYYIPSLNKACFAFIDYGVGILESLKNSDRGRFKGLFKDIYEFFKPSNNTELMKHLLNGDIHALAQRRREQSKTKQYYRGKGLPGIFRSLKRNHISNLVVISNDVLAYCDSEEYNLLSNKFSGTFVYWELNEQNHNLAWQI